MLKTRDELNHDEWYVSVSKSAPIRIDVHANTGEPYYGNAISYWFTGHPLLRLRYGIWRAYPYSPTPRQLRRTLAFAQRVCDKKNDRKRREQAALDETQRLLDSFHSSE